MRAILFHYSTVNFNQNYIIILQLWSYLDTLYSCSHCPGDDHMNRRNMS